MRFDKLPTDKNPQAGPVHTHRFDIVAANILSEVIMTLLDSVQKVISDNGLLICSGIIEENKNMVEKKMNQKGFEIIETQVRDSWVCIAGRLRA